MTTRTLGGTPVMPWRRWRTPAFWHATGFLALDGLAALVALFVLVPLTASLALVPVLLIGVLPLIPSLMLVGGFARAERFRIAAGLGVVIPVPRPRPPGWRTLLRDGPTWRAAAYTALRVLLGTADLVLLVTAWAGALALITLPIYYRWLTSGAADLGIVRISSLSAALAVAAAALVVTVMVLPLLTAGLVAVDLGLARRLLGPAAHAALSERVVELTKSRSRVVDAAAQERRRMERDLHDGAQQRLVAMSMTVGRLSSRLTKAGDTESAALAEQAQSEVRHAIVEIRDLTRGLHPPVLTDRGLDAALSAIAARSPIPVAVQVDLSQRPSLTVESIAYFFVSEALTNVAKHARASHATVLIRRDGDLLRASVTDDGQGGADIANGSGLRGLADRAAGVDGRLAVSSPLCGPTTLEMELPCGS